MLPVPVTNAMLRYPIGVLAFLLAISEHSDASGAPVMWMFAFNFAGIAVLFALAFFLKYNSRKAEVSHD